MNRVELTDEQFWEFARLLHETAGLSFDDSRRDSLAYSVAERMQQTEQADVASYLALLRGPGGTDERQSLLDEVTIPETHFFRNPPQIRALRTHVLPELLRQATGRRSLRIWSAGCATGEEPYTIAMLLRELLPASSEWDIKVVATDVSRRALAAAERGEYSERAFVMTEPLDLARWFVLDTTSRTFVVRDEVRELVEFRHHNLVTEPPPFEPGVVDLVLCRNVTIYFDRETTRMLMSRLHDRLRDGGYLFLGHAETLWQISDDFALVPLGDAFVYRRVDGPGPDGERRAVLPDRRTEAEPMPLRVDRRQSGIERRNGALTAAPASNGETATRTTRHERPTDPLLAVRAAVAAGQYDEAADLAADVVTATPLRAEAYYLLGLAATNLGRDAEALITLRKAVYLDPDLGFAHFLLAGALERLREPEAAARSYRAAAATLGGRPSDSLAPELGGRSIGELANLCRQLALRADEIARSQGGAA
jgi:chemotaxis protein methyltransferase CheR